MLELKFDCKFDMKTLSFRIVCEQKLYLVNGTLGDELKSKSGDL